MTSDEQDGVVIECMTIDADGRRISQCKPDTRATFPSITREGCCPADLDMLQLQLARSRALDPPITSGACSRYKPAVDSLKTIGEIIKVLINVACHRSQLLAVAGRDT